MKKNIIIFITTILLSSCSEKKEEKTVEADLEKITVAIEERNKRNIRYDTEKIEILSIIYGVQKDTLDKIILDYINATPIDFVSMLDTVNRDNYKHIRVIDSLSSLYKVDKTDFAKIIYDYKFKNENGNED